LYSILSFDIDDPFFHRQIKCTYICFRYEKSYV